MRDVTLRALDVLPAVTRERMTPAEAICEINVLQLQGIEASGAQSGESNGLSATGFGAVSIVLAPGAVRQARGLSHGATSEPADLHPDGLVTRSQAPSSRWPQRPPRPTSPRSVRSRRSPATIPSRLHAIADALHAGSRADVHGC
jgi:hypothetical protein